MDSIVQYILQHIASPLTALFGGLTVFLSSIIVFREQLVPLLSKLSPSLAQMLANIVNVNWSMGGFSFQIEFGQQIQKAKAQAKGIVQTVAASRPMPAPNLVRDPGKQSARDLVLAAWGAMQQIVYDACTASKMPLTPATRIPEAVRRLGNANIINADVAYLLNVLYDLGQTLANDPGLRPQEDDARGYKELADVVVDWMMLSILTPRNVEKPPQDEASKPRRQTVVGGHFPQPRPGYPIALLVGVGGPVQGQRFVMAQERYRIGSTADNDLRITGDAYVSAHHASLRYEKGSLFLADQGSTNGSFLNEKPVTRVPVMVRRGDRIRLGASVLQVAEAPTELDPGPRERTRVG
jgi:FHA domain-containing protein